MFAYVLGLFYFTILFLALTAYHIAYFQSLVIFSMQLILWILFYYIVGNASIKNYNFTL